MGTSASAWDLVRRSADAAAVSIASIMELDDADRVVRVIDRIWGEQALTKELLRAFQHAGSVVVGAESEGELVGFVLGFLGFRDGLHMHSHMLAVLPEWQSRGIGYALKLAQRAICLDHGIHEVRWTYDPLLARNGRFNLVKLGTFATRLLPHFYGEMTDLQNRGDRSDRFEVRWPLTSSRVERALGMHRLAPPAGEALLEAVGDPEAPRPKETGATAGPGATVAVPRDYQALRVRDPELAREWRDAASAGFQACFDAGLVAVWLTEESAYVFRPADGVDA